MKQCRWLVLDIYLAAILATSTSVNNCYLYFLVTNIIAIVKNPLGSAHLYY